MTLRAQDEREWRNHIAYHKLKVKKMKSTIEAMDQRPPFLDSIRSQFQRHRNYIHKKEREAIEKENQRIRHKIMNLHCYVDVGSSIRRRGKKPSDNLKILPPIVDTEKIQPPLVDAVNIEGDVNKEKSSDTVATSLSCIDPDPDAVSDKNTSRLLTKPVITEKLVETDSSISFAKSCPLNKIPQRKISKVLMEPGFC